MGRSDAGGDARAPTSATATPARGARAAALRCGPAAAAGAGYARTAKPKEVLAATGFEPGAVAPFPVPNISRVLFERGLLEWELVWAGAGSETHMLGISPIDLARVTQAEIVDIVEA